MNPNLRSIWYIFWLSVTLQTQNKLDIAECCSNTNNVFSYGAAYEHNYGTHAATLLLSSFYHNITRLASINNEQDGKKKKKKGQKKASHVYTGIDE